MDYLKIALEGFAKEKNGEAKVMAAEGLYLTCSGAVNLNLGDMHLGSTAVMAAIDKAVEQALENAKTEKADEDRHRDGARDDLIEAALRYEKAREECDYSGIMQAGNDIRQGAERYRRLHDLG